MKEKISNWLQNIYHIGMLVSIIFIMVQAYYARSSMIRTSEWEKAKMTIENIERFKEGLNNIPLSKNVAWDLGDEMWADVSTSKGWQLTDTLRKVYMSLFDSMTDADDYHGRMLDVLDAFAFPIVMGYASEEGSFQSAVFRQYYVHCNFILPAMFHHAPLMGKYAQYLYRLWRIKAEIITINRLLGDLKNNEWKPQENDATYGYFMKRIDHFLCYEEKDFSEASLKKYRKKLDKKLSEMEKEIAVFRKNSLK